MSLGISRTTTPRVRTLESLKSLFHMSMKTHDKHQFELSMELHLELTNLGLHLNGGCEIVGVRLRYGPVFKERGQSNLGYSD